MTDARKYTDWIWRTLAQRRAGLDDGEQLSELSSLAERLGRGHTTIYGAIVPGEALAEIRNELRPRLAREIEALHARGVEQPRVEGRSPLWPERARLQRLALWDRLSDLPADADAFGPYARRATHGVGGLRAVGFAPDSELLLVLSVNGRGVFDGGTGERVARDPESREHAQYPTAVPGIGPLRAVDVPMMGLDGGRALSRCTPDGWQLGVIDPSDLGAAWICPPQALVDEPSPEGGAVLLRHGFEELRAAGFSESGQTLIFAEQHTLQIFGRQDGPRDGQ